MIRIATVPVKSYLTKSKIPGAGYVINPYVGCPHKCLYCYAQFMCKFSTHQEDWGDFLDIKTGAAALQAQKLFHQPVLLSSVTDPYNIFEKKYRVTRRILEQLVHCQAYVSILTKSVLVVRDLDLLQQLPCCEVAFSFSTVDEAVRQLVEPGTCSVAEKTTALKTLHTAGISTAIMAAPLLPGISDWKQIIQQTAPYAREFRFDKLNMRSAFRRKVMDFIDVHYPHLLPLYNEIYVQNNQTYWDQLQHEIETYAQQHKLAVTVFFGKEHSLAQSEAETSSPIMPAMPLSQPQLFDSTSYKSQKQPRISSGPTSKKGLENSRKKRKL